MIDRNDPEKVLDRIRSPIKRILSSKNACGQLIDQKWQAWKHVRPPRSISGQLHYSRLKSIDRAYVRRFHKKAVWEGDKKLHDLHLVHKCDHAND